MRAGEKMKCPHCGEDTVLKSKPKLDGWTRIGEVLVCALCSAEIGEPGTAVRSGEAAAAELAELLGGEPEPCPRLEPGEEYRRFCRNCRFRIEHPFQLRCGTDGGEIDPGGCCDKFEPEERK